MSGYESIVREWGDMRARLGQVDPYTARKAVEKALLFTPFIAGEIDEISPCDIEQALCKLGSEGGRSGDGRCSSTLRAAHLAATQAVDWAVTRGIAKDNPFRLVPRPRARKARTRSLDQAAANQLAVFAEQTMRENMERRKIEQAAYCMAVLLALSTGMRRGEVFALEWPDFDGGSIMVRRAVKGGGNIGEPKSESGVRRIALGASFVKTLGFYRAWQESWMPQARWDEARYVIADANGNIANMSTFEHWWARFRGDAGFHGLKYHELRHTHASLLIGAGVDVKTVQTRMGHSSADITMNVYAHAMPRNDEIAAAMLVDMLTYAKEDNDER